MSLPRVVWRTLMRFTCDFLDPLLFPSPTVFCSTSVSFCCHACKNHWRRQIRTTRSLRFLKFSMDRNGCLFCCLCPFIGLYQSFVISYPQTCCIVLTVHPAEFPFLFLDPLSSFIICFCSQVFALSYCATKLVPTLHPIDFPLHT